MTDSFDKDYWEQIWHGDRAVPMGTGRANPHLVAEAGHLTPGTALDAGCGGGAEAIWLAEHGWEVTAVDIATGALAVAAERATAAGVRNRVSWVEADLSTWEPDSRYDLVATHYAHPAMPQLEFFDRIAAWVAPGGTLLIVGHRHHDVAAEHAHGPRQDDHAPPARASATVASVTARLDPTAWEIATAREARRTATGPGGRNTTLHDVVVRAVRLR